MGGSKADRYALAPYKRAGITYGDLHHLRHMLGVRPDKPKDEWGYRNYFAADESQVPSMDRLRLAGLVVKSREKDRLHIYHATERGGQIAGLSAEQVQEICVPSERADQ